MKKLIPAIAIMMVCFALVPAKTTAQSVNRDTMMVAAREIMMDTHYCALITIDSVGQPQTRTMNPYPPNDEFVTWFATSRTSRKIRELRNNPKVSVYYANHVNALGYVNITGIAQVIDDKELLLKMKRDYWSGIPDWQNKFVLIKIVPKTMEVINYKHKLNNNPDTFRAPVIIF